MRALFNVLMALSLGTGHTAALICGETTNVVASGAKRAALPHLQRVAITANRRFPLEHTAGG